MATANKDRPAQPQMFINKDYFTDFVANPSTYEDICGMSKREEMATQILAGLAAAGVGGTSAQRATTALADADALLVQLAL